MQATITIDRDMLGKAQDYLGLHDTSAVVDEALRALVEREASRALAKLGGSDPDFFSAPRQRFDPE